MKFVINSLEDVPEAFRAEYEARDGKFYLKGEGDYAPLIEANRKLAEFRDNNRSLNSKVSQLETDLRKFEGIDPSEHAALKTRLSEIEKTGVKGKEDIAGMIKSAVEAATSPLQEKLRLREESEARVQAELAQRTLENQIRDAGVAANVDERALPDFVNRGLRVFKLIEGKAAARNGETPIFSKDKPAEELSLNEWATGLQKEAPFLFKTSQGGGAGSTGAGRTTTGPKRVISGLDPLEFGRNIDAIIKGEVVVAEQ